MAVTVSGTSITFNDATVQTTAATGVGALTGVTAGTYYYGYSLGTPMAQTISGSAIKMAEIRAQCSGTVRVQWAWGSPSGVTTYYSRVYKNGVAQGTELSTGTRTVSTFDLAIAANDLVQIYMRSGGTCNTNCLYGFRIGISSPAYVEIHNNPWFNTGLGLIY